MKNIYFTILLLCIAVSSFSQDNAGGTENTKVFKSSNANGLIRHFAVGKADQQVVVTSQNNTAANATEWLPGHAGSPAKYSATTGGESNRAGHTVTFHFVPSNVEYWLVLMGTGSYFSAIISDGTQVTLDEGIYSLYCKQDYPFDMKVVLDKLNVNADKDTTITLASANLEITTQVVNENGSIIYPGDEGGNGAGLMVVFEEGSFYRYTGTCNSGSGITKMYTTPIPQGMQLAIGRDVEVTTGNELKWYMINYPVIDKLLNDTLITNTSDELHQYPVTINSTVAGSEYFWDWGYGTIANSSIIGYIDTFIPSFLWNNEQAPANGTIRYYANNAYNDSTIVFFSGYVVHTEFQAATSPAVLNTPYLIIDTNDDLIMSIQGNIPAVTGDSRIAPGKGATVGSGTPFNFSRSYNLPDISTIRLYTHFRGQANERRYVDNSLSTYELKLNGQVLQSDTLRTLAVYLPWYEPGRYQVNVKNTNYEIHGIPGKHLTQFDFEMGGFPDMDPPSLVSFKVLQGDTVAEEITNGLEASVEFTAADYGYIPGSMNVPYSDPTGVAIYYKDHNLEEWHLLPLEALTEELDTLAGMPYRADLSQLMYEVNDSTWIDLKIELKDDSRNDNNQSFLPAFYFNDVLAGTHTVPASSFKFYPNPVTGILRANFQPAYLIIYTIIGQKIHSQPWKGSLNTSFLSPGTYLLKAIMGDGSTVVRKVQVRK